MSLANYNWLKSHLEDIERQVTPPSPLDFPGAAFVRTPGPKYGDSIQAVALDMTTRNQSTELPVVVAVGINYTQGTEQVPRKSSIDVRVEQSNKSCRSNVLKGIRKYEVDRESWSSSGRAASRHVFVHELLTEANFHFVLTNFCIWITTSKWPDNESGTDFENLLWNNGLFGGRQNSANFPLHLNAIADALRDKSVLWVAHGFHNAVPRLFSEWARSKRIENWLLMPNLAFYYRYYETCKYVNKWSFGSYVPHP